MTDFRAASAAALALLAVATGSVFAPDAQADGNAAQLDQIVAQAYVQFQRGCTPNMTPQFQRIAWDAPPGGQGGSGRIVDATEGLGGPFEVYWNVGGGPYPGAQKVVPATPNGYWDIVFEFC